MPSADTTEHLREREARTAIEPITLRVPEACCYLGISRSTLYRRLGSDPRSVK